MRIALADADAEGRYESALRRCVRPGVPAYWFRASQVNWCEPELTPLPLSLTARVKR
jgi:hypothetical protein